MNIYLPYGTQMSSPPDLTSAWNALREALTQELLQHLQQEEAAQALCRALQLEKRIQQHGLTQAATFPTEEIERLLQLFALFEEKIQSQNEAIDHLSKRVEKLEEENLQTRIEAAKHHLDSMEKLALLQHKLNTITHST